MPGKSAAQEGPHQPRILATLQLHHPLEKRLLRRTARNSVHMLLSRLCRGCWSGGDCLYGSGTFGCRCSSLLLVSNCGTGQQSR